MQPRLCSRKEGMGLRNYELRIHPEAYSLSILASADRYPNVNVHNSPPAGEMGWPSPGQS